MPWQDRFSSREDFLVEVKRLVMVEGLSYRVAAEAIGNGVTKNQVVRAMQTIMGKHRGAVRFPDSVWPSKPRVEGRDSSSDAIEGPIHITQAKDGHCRAPLWPDFLHSREKADPSEHVFCGQKCKEGSAYCEEHHALFYPPELQKRVSGPKREEVKDNSRYFG